MPAFEQIDSWNRSFSHMALYSRLYLSEEVSLSPGLGIAKAESRKEIPYQVFTDHSI
jgi:hypothetical protein